MHLTRCGRGIVLLAMVLGFYGFFFDDIPAAMAAGALVFLLIARSVVFLSALSSGAASVAVTRTVSSRFVRQGMAVGVTTRIGHTIRPSFSLHATDLLPDGAVLTAGSLSEVSDGSIRYTIVPMSIGMHAFPGIRLTLSDLFFTATLVGQLSPAAAPPLIVLPASDYALPGKDFYSESESRTISPFPGPDIRSFRTYIPGDDPRKIDWKLSAKHDALFIREYMGRSETARLLIIDLPDASLPFSPGAFTRLKEAAVAAAASRLSRSERIPVLLISGANIITFSPGEGDPANVIALMRQLAPAPRLHHLYRYASTPALRRMYPSRKGQELTRPPENESAPETFAGTLASVTGSFLSRRAPTRYESQLARVLHPFGTCTAHLFSLAGGDVSHLRLLVEQAALRGMTVHLHIPDESYTPATRANIGRCSFSSVEVV